MNTADHIVFASPEALWERASPGAGSPLVGNSGDLPRAISCSGAALSGATDGAGAVAAGFSARAGPEQAVVSTARAKTVDDTADLDRCGRIMARSSDGPVWASPVNSTPSRDFCAFDQC